MQNVSRNCFVKLFDRNFIRKLGCVFITRSDSSVKILQICSKRVFKYLIIQSFYFDDFNALFRGFDIWQRTTPPYKVTLISKNYFSITAAKMQDFFCFALLQQLCFSKRKGDRDRYAEIHKAVKHKSERIKCQNRLRGGHQINYQCFGGGVNKCDNNGRND